MLHWSQDLLMKFSKIFRLHEIIMFLALTLGCFRKSTGWKFFYHLPTRISLMCMRIYFLFQKTYKNKKISTSKFIRTNLHFFSLSNKGLFVFQQRKVLLEKFFKCKLHLKKSVKLINIFFAAALVRIFFVILISGSKGIFFDLVHVSFKTTSDTWVTIHMKKLLFSSIIYHF